MKKICKVCKQEKDIDDFHFRKRYKNNHIPQCKECFRKKMNTDKKNKRGIHRCINRCIICGDVLEIDKYKHRNKYCNNCREDATKELQKIASKKWFEKKYQDKEFRKKESIRKAIWWKKKQEIKNNK